MVNKQEALKLADKVESGRRLSAAEQATLANYTKILENLPTVNALKAGNARNVAAIKDAVSRGINPGISSSAGGLIPPPPSFDPFHGKVCQGPGVKRLKLGQPKVCGRQATGILRRFTPDVPKAASLDEAAAEINARLAMSVYAGANGKVHAGSGQMVGSLVPGPFDPPGPEDAYVCFYHGLSAYAKALHPDDNNGAIPDTGPKRDEPLMGLEHLDRSRQWRTVQTDPNFCAVTDGVTTVLVETRHYIKYLKANGALPERGQAL